MDQNLSKPLVSINVATYNRGNFIAEMIESILAQTYTNWELIIVDDASTDDTKAIVDLYLKDQRLKYYRNEINLNVCQTRNIALEKSVGKYIAILDSDDLWSNQNKLDQQVSFLEKNPDYGVIGTGVIVIDKNGSEMKRYEHPLSDQAIRSQLLIKNTFAHSSTLILGQALRDIGGYNPSLNGIEDYDIWLKIGLKYKFANLPGHFLKYRVHGSNISLVGRKRLMKINLDLIKQHQASYPNYGYALARRLIRYWAYSLANLWS